MRRKICVVTGSRAEYGLLYWLIKGLKEDRRAELQLVVTGAHLSPQHGNTVETIEQDGFPIRDRIDIELSDDSKKGIAHSLATATKRLAECFEKISPDLLVILGDRFEILAAAQAAMICRIPIAHIHGGEATEGLIDEAIRHAVTKMAHLHLVATERYKNRVIQLGEFPDQVFNTGAPGIDNIRKLKPLTRTELSKELGLSEAPYFMVTYHPVTLSPSDPAAAFKQICLALDEFPLHQILFTAPNADTHSHRIVDFIHSYVSNNPARAHFVPSLGQTRYLSSLTYAKAVIGNSSSGIIEAPSLGVATINVGKRQQGRLRASSVVDCEEEKNSIVTAIHKILSESFQASLKNIDSPYGTGGASDKIREILLTAPLEGILFKKFYNLDQS